MAKTGTIYTGIGGWTFEPWRGVFYPQGLPHAKELEYASRQLTSIEVNGTFYRTQNAKTFRKWADETPESFVFALKGVRYAVNRRVLAEAGDSIKRFVESGITELGDKLGPLLWQFAPTKKFEEADFGRFLALLPRSFDGRKLRHVIEPRNESFSTPAFIKLAREFGVSIVYTDHIDYVNIADITGDFVYARLQRGKDKVKTGYAPKDLDVWAKHAQTWASGNDIAALPHADKSKPAAKPRDVFIYFIHEGKVRAPAAALALIERLK
jgi:uncharacterized protein YecE (DUF72 family)